MARSWQFQVTNALGGSMFKSIDDWGQTGHAECLDLPLESTDFVPGEDDQPEARIDLVFDWSCE